MVDTEKLLILLAEKLKTVENSQFNMRDYYHEDETPACCIGWAGTIPEWQEIGVYKSPHFLYPVPNLSGLEVGKVLGLSMEQTKYLFYAEQIPQNRAKAIRRLREVASGLTVCTNLGDC